MASDYGVLQRDLFGADGGSVELNSSDCSPAHCKCRRLRQLGRSYSKISRKRRESCIKKIEKCVYSQHKFFVTGVKHSDSQPPE